MAKVTVKRWLPASVLFEGEQINIEVKRQSLGEFLAFESEYFTYARPMPGGFEAPADEVEKRTKSMLAWLEESFTKFVRVPTGEVNDEGSAVTEGKALHDLASGQLDFKIDVMNQIWSHNRFGEEVRKKLRSLSGSATTSDEPRLALPGTTPEPTAAHAKPEGFVPTEAVDLGAVSTGMPSGETSA